jgi:hypothetical protein
MSAFISSRASLALGDPEEIRHLLILHAEGPLRIKDTDSRVLGSLCNSWSLLGQLCSFAGSAGRRSMLMVAGRSLFHLEFS